MFIPLHDNNPTQRLPVATFALIGLNAVVFLVWWLSPPAPKHQALFHLGFVPARVRQIAHGEAIRIEVPLDDEGPGPRREAPEAILVELQPGAAGVLFSAFSCMFMHGGWMHIIGNMWFLWLFGNNVEDRLGSVIFLALYLMGGLLATICHWVSASDSVVPVVGASGAVSTILGAYVVTWPKAKVRVLWMLGVITTVEVPAVLVLGVWFVGQVVEGFVEFRSGLGGGVAWWAHIGGFLAGLAAMPVLSKLVRQPEIEVI